MEKALERLSAMVHKIEDVFRIAQVAFNKHKMSEIKKAEALAQDVHDEELDLTSRFFELSVTTSKAKLYTSIPGHLEKIVDNLEHMLHGIRKKIEERILFTEKVVGEFNELFENIEALLKHLGDLILTGNPLLAQEVERLSYEITNNATEYATQHEDRLIEGLCLPVALSSCIHMLDAIKGISWHAREIAQAFSQNNNSKA